MPAWKESVRQGSPSWPGHDTWTTGHAGGGGSQAPASTVVTVKVASTFPPRPSVTVTRTSCGPRRRLFRSQTTNLPLPEMDPSVVEYWYRSLSPSASVAVTSRSTSGLANKWDHGQISTLVIDELKESITGGLLRCRRGFCCEAVTTGNNRATKITIRRFTNPSLQLRSRSLKSAELIPVCKSWCVCQSNQNWGRNRCHRLPGIEYFVDEPQFNTECRDLSRPLSMTMT